MKILQIWLNDTPPNSKRMGCIKNILSLAKKRDIEVLFISDVKISRSTVIKYISAKEYIKSMCEDKQLSFCVDEIRKRRLAENIKNVLLSDIIRFHFLINNNDILYLDTDIKLRDIPQTIPEYTYLSKDGTFINYDIMYNGNKDVLKKILNVAIMKFTYQTSVKKFRPIYSWMMWTLNSNLVDMKEVRYFTPEQVYHFNIEK